MSVVALSIITTLLASVGFWTFLIAIIDKKSARTKMILGLGHDKIMELCMKCIDRGNITKSEYENLHDYLYVPYKKMGGNGIADRLMKEVEKLDIIPDSYGRKAG